MSTQKIKYPLHYQKRRGFNDAFIHEKTMKSNPVFNDIKIILWILKFTGLFPFYEEISNSEVGPPKRPNYIYSICIRVVVLALTVFNLYSLFMNKYANLFYSYRDTENINQWVEIFLFILTYTLMVIICARNSKAFIKIMNEILQVDDEIYRQNGITLTNNCGFTLRYLLIIIISHIYINILKVYIATDALTLWSYTILILYSLENSLSLIFIIFASALLKVIAVRFAFLNHILDSYSYIQQAKLKRHLSRFGENGLMEAFPEESLFVYRMHNRLLHIYKSTNDSCSLILVGFMGYTFYSITTTTYNLFIEITADRQISVNVLQWCMAWLAMHVCLLSILSRNCGQATREANTTSQILARTYGKSKEYQNIIDKFLTKSIKQEVQFTAYGFFVIDNSTLFKIFSAVTTYLVILIQFKQLEDSKMEDQLAAEAEAQGKQ